MASLWEWAKIVVGGIAGIFGIVILVLVFEFGLRDLLRARLSEHVTVGHAIGETFRRLAIIAFGLAMLFLGVTALWTVFCIARNGVKRLMNRN